MVLEPAVNTSFESKTFNKCTTKPSKYKEAKRFHRAAQMVVITCDEATVSDPRHSTHSG